MHSNAAKIIFGNKFRLKTCKKKFCFSTNILSDDNIIEKLKNLFYRI